MADIAAEMSRVLGRDIKYVDVPPEESKRQMMQIGMPAWQADAINQLMADLKAGKYARLTDVVKTIGHKTPVTLEQFILANEKAFQPA
jgi:hypothetical protein